MSPSCNESGFYAQLITGTWSAKVVTSGFCIRCGIAWKITLAIGTHYDIEFQGITSGS